jgi:phage-related protein
VKPIRFLGTSLEDLRRFPTEARQAAGFQLHKVQLGEPPDDWKPMGGIGRGVIECRIREASGAFRLLYVSALPDAIHVLHVFRKTTMKTSRLDLVLGRKRYMELIRSRE